MSAPFFRPYFRRPDRPGDRLLRLAGLVERALRAVARRLLAGRAPLRREDRDRLRPVARQRRQPEDPRALAPNARPLLYLPALPWHERYQRPQQLAAGLARQGRPVIYLETFDRQRLQPRWQHRVLAPGLERVSRRLTGRPDPFRQALPPSEIEAVAEEMRRSLREPPAAVVAQLPFWLPLAVALRYAWGVPLVYDRIDLHTEFPGVPPEVGRREEELLTAADLVTATSPDLLERSRPFARRVEALPNGVDRSFLDFPQEPTPAVDSEGEWPVAGMVGALDQRIDTAALARLLDSGRWRIRLAGRLEHPAMEALARSDSAGGGERLELLGEIPFDRVAPFLGSLQVGLVPYRDLAITRAIDSVKVYEMLALGLPVVVRRLPGTEHWAEVPGVHLYDDGDDLAGLLDAALARDSNALRRQRREAVVGASWEARARRLGELIDELRGTA
ncbi:MAG: glycosyltransferase [Acidobacteriota bacterium]